MKYDTEAVLEILAAALMCGQDVPATTSDPRDALDEAYDRLNDRLGYHNIPFPKDMRNMGYFEWVGGKPYTVMRVTEKGLQFLKSGGRDEN